MADSAVIKNMADREDRLCRVATMATAVRECLRLLPLKRADLRADSLRENSHRKSRLQSRQRNRKQNLRTYNRDRNKRKNSPAGEFFLFLLDLAFICFPMII